MPAGRRHDERWGQKTIQGCSDCPTEAGWRTNRSVPHLFLVNCLQQSDKAYRRPPGGLDSGKKPDTFGVHNGGHTLSTRCPLDEQSQPQLLGIRGSRKAKFASLSTSIQHHLVGLGVVATRHSVVVSSYSSFIRLLSWICLEHCMFCILLAGLCVCAQQVRQGTWLACVGGPHRRTAN